ncbi:hypothetical protein D9C73_011307 [Collichthys lucidus]|uniref:Uncharacterized protein n=1 Tax=Collichthys lucidus TaxID=240159 RepID=A0A4U5UQ89_COLLU|nr:hypothetical protein D9C73_011307 [Collichthys lucidus]
MLDLQTTHLHPRASFYNLEAASICRLWQTACNVVIHDHCYSSKRLIAVRRTERTKKPAGHRQCPCCRDSQHSATPARLPQKRKRTSVARPSQPSPGQVPTASTSSLDQHDLLRYKNGHPRPYTLELGRQIKTELWERVGRPSFTETPAGHLHLQTLASSCTMTIQPAGCLHLQTVASSCTLILYLPASASRPPSSADSAFRPPPPADSSKQLYPYPPPASLFHQPANRLHLQAVESGFRLILHPRASASSLQPTSSFRLPPPTDRASSCTLILYLPASAYRPPSSADSGKQLKPDPPPTCLCHQPAVNLQMQIVARSGSLILHLPASATSLQTASTCRRWKPAGRLHLQIPASSSTLTLHLPAFSTSLQTASTCRRPPSSADSGKQLKPDPPPTCLCHQPAVHLHMQIVARSGSLILHLPASATSLQTASTSRLWQAALTGYNLQCNVVIHDHSYSSKRLIAVRRTERTKKPAGHRQCPCCRDSQHSATPARLPQKRKRTSVARPSQPSPGQVPTASTSSLDQHDLLRYKNGHPRPYTLELGRQIKTELWERVGRPSFTETPAGHLHLQTLASSCTMTIQPAGCLHLQTVASSCTLILYLPASASRPPSSADSAFRPPPPADSSKQLYPYPPPASLFHQPANRLHLQAVESGFRLILHPRASASSLQPTSSFRLPPPTDRASSCTLILYLPASAYRPPSSADSGKQLKPDPPPTCLCHQPAVHLQMQIVARSGSLILHLPASATSLQAASTCRFQQAAVPLPSTCQPFPPACRPPPPAGGGNLQAASTCRFRQAALPLPSTCQPFPPACRPPQPADAFRLPPPADRASSCTLILYLPASASRPPSSADSGKQLKPDPPPTCLCHQPAVHLHMQIVARSGSLILHLPASATSLQAASTCRFQQAALPLPSTYLPLPPACRPPPPPDCGKQL